VLRVRPLLRVPKYLSADASTLMRRLNLNLAHLQRVAVLDELNHTYALTVEFHGINIALRPALGKMLNVSRFIPAAPSGNEEIEVRRSPKRLKPGFVLRSGWNKTILHAPVTVSAWMR
jgi:hypothetical protein